MQWLRQRPGLHERSVSVHSRSQETGKGSSYFLSTSLCTLPGPGQGEVKHEVCCQVHVAPPGKDQLPGRPAHTPSLTLHGVFIGLLGILNVKDLSHLLNDLSTEMGRQSVGGGWECVEADLPTALGGGRKLVMSLREQMTNQRQNELPCQKQ